MNHHLEFSEPLGKFGFILEFLMQSISEKQDKRARTTRADSMAMLLLFMRTWLGAPVTANPIRRHRGVNGLSASVLITQSDRSSGQPDCLCG